jgi:small conductance mechanosensitive channel
LNWKEILNNVFSNVIHWTATGGVRLIIALLIMFISFKIVNRISKKILAAGDKGRLDKTLAKTFAYIFKIGAKCIIAVCLVGFVGIDTSGIAAVLVSLGACVGLALNGTLSNLAGGILLIITRPFKVDDFIEAQGYSGTVEEIHITNTQIRTPDNKVVYIPNGALSTGTILNYSVKDIRRVDFTFSIAYSNDFEKAKKIVMDVFSSHEMILDDPEPMVRVSEHGASSINIVARAWAKNGDYWTVKFDVLEAVKAAFDKEGIEIPFNQLDVHVKND